MQIDLERLTEKERKLVASNIGLVYQFVDRFRDENTDSIPRDDLIQIGSIGLIKAIKKYTYKKVPFPTFAIYYIKNEILLRHFC